MRSLSFFKLLSVPKLIPRWDGNMLVAAAMFPDLVRADSAGLLPTASVLCTMVKVWWSRCLHHSSPAGRRHFQF